MLFDESFLHKLERLSLITRTVRLGQTQGERRSTKRGTSVEFADYRDYAQGDDLRKVDWNIYARLERPFVKLFEEEQDLAVYLLLDASRSMDWGNGPDDSSEHNKWIYARRLAAALGYIALTSGDRLVVSALTAAQATSFGPIRGRGHILRLLEWLEAQPATGQTDIDAALKRYALRANRAGLVVLISDLLSPSGYVGGLNALAAHGHEVVLIHLLSPDELEPTLAGDLRLIDSETGMAQEVTIDGGVLDRYRRRLDEWRAEIRNTLRSRGAHYLPIESALPLERVVLTDLQMAGIVR